VSGFRRQVKRRQTVLHAHATSGTATSVTHVILLHHLLLLFEVEDVDRCANLAAFELGTQTVRQHCSRPCHVNTAFIQYVLSLIFDRLHKCTATRCVMLWEITYTQCLVYSPSLRIFDTLSVCGIGGYPSPSD